MPLAQTDRGAIVVAGAGRIGSGIGLALAYAGLEVALCDLKTRPPGAAGAALAAAGRRIGFDLAVLEEAGVISAETAAAIGARISYGGNDEADAALARAGFVFEAVPEVRALKREVLARIGAGAPAPAVIASATSTFLVDELSAHVPAPERFLNTHWLNPAYLIPLVEVSPGVRTSRETLDTAMALLRRAGKVPIECAPSPGYIVPRIQALAMNEAARLAEEGVATPEAIDTASRLGFGVRFAVLGLLEFIDWGGADTLLRASEYLRDELQTERFAPPASVVSRGGAGSGAGSFRTDRGNEHVRETILRFVGLLRHLELMPEPVGSGESIR